MNYVSEAVEENVDLKAVTCFDVTEFSNKSLVDLPNGRLHGIPFLVKDNINTSGFPTTAGTPALFKNRPNKNAPVVNKLINEGAVLVGKTAMHELAFGGTSNNYATGCVRNPHDRTCIPGGSSGGSAAAVAAGIVPFALGSDTGGSVRIPAALCGVVGLRPSRGRYSTEGMGSFHSSKKKVHRKRMLMR